MKKFICGFLIGAMLFGAVGAFAASYIAEPATFKVMVNGGEFVSDPPALVVEGKTYLPLRAMGDALGVPVEWNAELHQAEVGIITNSAPANYITYAEKPWCPDFGKWIGKTPYADFEKEGSYSYIYKSSGITTADINSYCELLKSLGFEMRTIENGYAFANADRTKMLAISWESDDHVYILVY